MGDKNLIRTLGDYSIPSHKGYRNTIELCVGNNVVPLRSDTIRLMQNDCLFHGLWYEDPNQHLKGFLKLVDSLNLDGNFTYIIDFMIVKDISSIIDPRLSQVVTGRPFVEISNMTRDPLEVVVRFPNGTDEFSYKMPHKIEHYNSLLDLEKEHTKSVYLRNDEDKRRGLEYVMSKILGFYKECLEIGPEYVIRIDDEGEVTKFLINNEEEFSQTLETAPGFFWGKFPDAVLRILTSSLMRFDAVSSDGDAVSIV
uniref:Protein kinase-like domain, concanavalin A-like lectin/glucanase domain protein n=1 Tax=Tanacetum cinerariifolium TaxID=118510 RepID=A0A6L2N924_TANCI|nr:protein kinase-like domain, concanavalin A-like lectin/glucanase domain protein [Tanacetum cinerariifolium]